MISVVLPVYNGEKYIKESIDSVICQSYKDWELIIVDDCSNDSTSEIIAEYADTDKRIKVRRNEKNLRLPGSLNVGFRAAQGEYLTWTSDDNRYKENAFDVMLREISNNEADFVFSGMDYIDAEGDKTGECFKEHGNLNDLYYTNIVGACFLYTRDVYNEVGEYNTDLFMIEDYDYWVRIYNKFPIKYIPQSLYEYRTHGGSLTAQRQILLEQVKMPFYDKMLNDAEISERLDDRIKGKIYSTLAIAAFRTADYYALKKYVRLNSKLDNKYKGEISKKVYLSSMIGKRLFDMMKKP